MAAQTITHFPVKQDMGVDDYYSLCHYFLLIVFLSGMGSWLWQWRGVRSFLQSSEKQKVFLPGSLLMAVSVKKNKDLKNNNSVHFLLFLHIG